MPNYPPKKIPKRWLAVILAIPGYDPLAAGAAYYFDSDAAERALGFFQGDKKGPGPLTHVKGELAGEPFRLAKWQAGVVANLFGWKRKSDRTRRYRECLIFIPRKNGKTTFAAGLLLCALFNDQEPGAEVYGAAAKREQAALVFDQAAGMCRNEKVLMDRVVIYGGLNQTKSIMLKDHSGSYRTISADANTAHGFNSHFVVVDELHAQPNRNLVDVLATSMGSRRQPLLVCISTSDFERPGSICNEKHAYASNVRDGVIEDPSFLPVIYEATIDDDWTDPNVWAKANPNLGVSVKREYIERECRKAQEVPGYENTFKRLHLNIRTEQAVRWLPMDAWDECAGVIDPEALRGKRCFAGLDLSNKIDLSALVLLFPDDDYAVLPFFWVPEDTARIRESRDRVPYLQWIREGLIEATPGNVIDYAFIRHRINELKALYDIQQIGYDPWNATQLALQLKDDDGMAMVEFRQGYISMNDPSKEFEVLILARKLNHGGNPVLRWMASNATVKRDPVDNIKPDKEKAPERIDGIVATIMALGLNMVSTTEAGSVYDERGLLSLSMAGEIDE